MFGIVTAIIILGGIESIAAVCEKLVPLMALFYVVGCIVILVRQLRLYLLPALQAIFVLAFKPGAVDRRTGRRRYPSGAAVRRGARPVLE